ncbi:PilN domain-containing protein [Legionella nagasakiensis]|uniref:PilN domain-containing protein n=1 Tax=Legionella nagasakiensis TaxID=535290 RepID=UPI0010557DDD|nr:PilN domain-containing protein [Legionella nagasakiensis]
MTEINLLPWRELKREREKKQFTIYLFLALISAAAVVFLINIYAKQLIEHQSSRNQLLENEITRLKQQIKEIEEIKAIREALIARMIIIQNLQATRSLTVRLFDELIKIMPDGVFLTYVERKEDKITILGYAESNSNISQLMRNIENNNWIKEPYLTEIKKTQEESSSRVENEFKLSFILSPKFDGQNHE